MPAFARLEIWSDLACASGTRLGTIADAIALPERRQLDGDDTLTLTLPRRSDAWSLVREHRVLRVVWADGTFDEWRITGIPEEQAGATAKVLAASPLLDLGRGMIERTEADGSVWPQFELLGLTPSAFLSTIILPAAPSYFALGTVNPAAPVDLAFDATTPLAALRALAELTGAELQVRRNGTTGYYVDLVTAIGASAAVVTLRLGKNVLGFRRSRETSEHATRIYGRGAGEEIRKLTIAEARWRVSAIAGSDVTLEDPNGADGPIGFDDQLNGLYFREDGAASGLLVNDSVAATQKVTLAAVTGLAVGDVGRFERNSAGDDLTYLEAPAAKATYGLLVAVLDRTDLPPVRNLVPNPQLNGTYGSGLPSGWSKVGSPTTSEETASLYARYGGKSCKVVATAGGQGLVCSAFTVRPTSDQPNFAAFASVLLTAGKVRVEFVDSTGRLYPDGTAAKAWTGELTVWKELGYQGADLLVVGATSAQVRIVADGGAATFYVDAAQCTQTAAQEAFYAGAGATALWQAVNDALAVRKDPAVSIRVELLDRYRLDAAVFAGEQLVLGGTVRYLDPDMGDDISTRIVALERNVFAALETAVELSNRAEDLTDALVRPARRQRPVTNAAADVEPAVSARFEDLAGDPGHVRVTLSARPAADGIYYIVQEEGDTVPVLGLVGGTGEWAAYGVSFVLSRLETTHRQLSAYARLGSRYSRAQTWIVDRDTVPSVAAAITENPGGTAIVTWTPDDDVASVRLYRKKNGSGNGWPTLNNNVAGVLDEAQLVGTIWIAADGGAVSRLGAPLTGMSGGTGVGGTQWSEAGYAPAAVVKVILVPVDGAGNVGDRVTTSRTMSGAASPRFTALSAALDSNGIGCDTGDQAKYTCSWTTADASNGGAVPGTHNVRLWRSVNGDPWETWHTEASPVTNTSKQDTAPGYYYLVESRGGQPTTIQYKAELLDSAGAVIDTALADEISGFTAHACEVA